MSNSSASTSKKLNFSIATVIILAVCLCITTFALIYSTVISENNLFETGRIKINLNDSKPVIEEHEFLFEPGMTVQKSFFLENESTWDVYYKLYFDNIDGGLADVLDVKIETGDKTLYSGKISDLTEDGVIAADDVLRLNERRDFTIVFHFPENSNNGAQNQSVSFNLNAKAVQTKNNSDRVFS